MPDHSEREVTEDDEELYRRIPASQEWYKQGIDSHPSLYAFRPTDQDVTGLSLSRSTLTSLQEAAKGRAGKSYYVAVLRAGDLRRRGIEVVSRPEPGNPGHAELPELNRSTRDTDRVREMMTILATELCLRVEGPFETPPSST